MDDIRGELATVLVIAVIRNMALAALPGNVVVPSHESGLKHDSVANVTAMIMDLIDKGLVLVLSL